MDEVTWQRASGKAASADLNISAKSGFPNTFQKNSNKPKHEEVT